MNAALHPAFLASAHLGRTWHALDPRAQRVLEHVAQRRVLAHQPPQESRPSLAQRAADRLAVLLGSWGFVGLFLAWMGAWLLLNSYWMLGGPFDPFPFILLNLMLSMLAALQAPVILMVQNRQAQQDRLQASHDYEINLKAELEVMQLHDKVDRLGAVDWPALLATQREHTRLLNQLVKSWRVRE